MRAAGWLPIAVVGLGLALVVWFRPAADPPGAGAPGVIDIGFAQHMSQHHDQALMLVDVFLQGHETELAPFAKRIREAQLVEIGQMRGWLALWDEPLAPERRAMDWMLAGSTPPDDALRAYLLSCEASPSGMPGLATTAEVRALTEAEGEARDRRFLQLMQRHHEGGLPMLRFATEEAGHPAVRQLAERMLVDQTRELARMRSSPLLAGRSD